MRVLLGLSGGLDSTYAAVKLREMGCDVEAALLIMHPYTEVSAAEESAAALGLPLHKLDVQREFEDCVVPNFINEYKNGRTPNPCIICNSEIKFKYLLKYALDKGFDMIATGHYAGICRITSGDTVRYAVKRSLDARKDQTYMLWRLPQEVLSHLMLPLDSLSKEEIRESARTLGLASADRADSQEICFIPSGDYASFIEESIGPSAPGNFVDSDGNILGRHKGIIHYTKGQRKGLGIALGARAFITDIDSASGNITLSFDASDTGSLTVSGIVFSGVCEPKAGESSEYYVKLRYQAPAVKCLFTYLGSGRGRVELSAPVRSVTPGQSAVFYKDDYIALGGFID